MRLRGEAKALRDAEMQKLFEAGQSLSSIGKQYGLSHSTVRYAVNPEFAAVKRGQMRFRYYLSTADLEAGD